MSMSYGGACRDAGVLQFRAGAIIPPTAPIGAAFLQLQCSTWLRRKRNKIKGGPDLVKSRKDELCRSGRGRGRVLCWFQIQKAKAAARTFLPTLLVVLSAFYIRGDQVLLFFLPWKETEKRKIKVVGFFVIQCDTNQLWQDLENIFTVPII